MVPRFRRRALGVAVAIAWLAAACSDGGGDDRGSASATTARNDEPWGPAGWEVVDEAPELPAVDLGERLWGTGHVDAVQSVRDVELRGDAVALHGYGADEYERLAVVEGPTGQLRWTVDIFRDLPGGDGATWHPFSLWTAGLVAQPPDVLEPTGDDDRWTIPVSYSLVHAADATPEYGVASLSGADGHVLWKTPLASSRPEDEDPAGRLDPGPLVANDGLVVASTRPTSPVPPEPSDPDYLNRMELVALDAADGRPLWRQTGAWPLAVADGAVFALMPVETTAPTDGDTPAVTTAALDPATGERLWDLSHLGTSARLVLTAGDAALIENMEASETLIVDVTSGEELATFGTSTVFADDCDADASLIACIVIADPSDPDSDALATFDVENRDPRVAARTFVEEIGVEAASVRGVVDGRVFVGGPRSANTALDRAGQVVDPDPGGVFLAMSDRLLVVGETGDTSSPGYAYEVHAVTAGS
jgi:outer membrane protein assembly factor BamB